MNALLRSDIIAHAKAEYPRECCGLILNLSGKSHYRACRNISEGTTEFSLDPVDYARCEDEGQIVGVVHSHCNGNIEPSQADRVSCEISGLPWTIVQIPNEEFLEFFPENYKAPLIGRAFSHGVLDCYALIRDWYSEQGIALPDFERPEKWWEKGFNLYADYFPNNGFHLVTGPLERGDIILMQIGATVANHAGVYLGDNVFIHHAIGRLSTRDVYGGYWQQVTRSVIRRNGGLCAT
jgi:proteasome lid subunit RPN8/RPN11